MSNLDITFLTKKHEELKTNGDIVILKPEDNAKIPDLKEISCYFKDIKSFYIGEGEEKRIVLQYKTYIPYENRAFCKKEGERAFYTHDYARAATYYKVLLSTKKELPHIYARLGLSYLHLKEIYKAIDCLTIATELCKKRKKRKYDFTNLINNIKQKADNQEESKNTVNMQETDFKYDLDNNYGVTKLKDVATIINFHHMSIEEACQALKISDDDKYMIMLFVAKESYAKGDYDLGDQILRRIEKIPDKTPKIKQLLEEIRLNRIFYKNRITDDYQPLIRIRAKIR